MEEWVVLTLSAVLIWAVLNTLDRFTLVNWLKNPQIPLLVQAIASIGAFLAVVLLQGIQVLPSTDYLLVLVSGCSLTLMNFWYFKSIQIEETSRTVSMLYVTPFFVAVEATVFLGETFSFVTYAGIVLIVLGALLTSSRGLRLGRSLPYMILTPLAMSISMTLTKYLVGQIDVWSVFAYTRLASALTTLPLFVGNFSEFLQVAKQRGGRVVTLMSLNETTNMFAFLLITIATSVGYVTLINSLTSLQPLFVFLITIPINVFFPTMLREESDKFSLLAKLVAIILILVGTLIIV